MPYLYNGPPSSVALHIEGADGAVETREYVLMPGREIDLPAGHEYTEALLAQRYLTEPPPVEATQETEQ